MLRSADVFVKPRADLRSKSVSGGVITLVAGTTAALLFLGQIYVYIKGTTQHTLELHKSLVIPMLPTTSLDPFQSRMYDIKGKVPLKIHITFPFLGCKDLDIKLNGAKLQKSDFDRTSSTSFGPDLLKQQPNSVELQDAFGRRYKEMQSSETGGCTLRTTLRVPLVAGHVMIGLSKSAWTEALNHLMLRSRMSEEEKAKDPSRNRYNMSHFIHSIQFGKKFHKAASHPLERHAHKIENSMGGIALESIQVKLVPTLVQGFWGETMTYQLSVVEHTVQPETMVSQSVGMLPGLALGYDVTPLEVCHTEGRENILVFLSSLISIVGGVFVTVSLLTGCLVHSASAVAKKVD